mmetsp:Transcript_947/g.3109  ORF Transcript_947/g.3109 Transcript_947/m.3109 type:complete len:203 (-) Transcript_947:1366-1974(-)
MPRKLDKSPSLFLRALGSPLRLLLAFLRISPVVTCFSLVLPALCLPEGRILVSGSSTCCLPGPGPGRPCDRSEYRRRESHCGGERHGGCANGWCSPPHPSSRRDDDLAVKIRGMLFVPRTVALGVVHVVKSKAFAVAVRPLEVVEKRPRKIAFYVHSVVHRRNHLLDVLVVVRNTPLIFEHRRELPRALPRSVTAVFGDVDG